MRLYYDDPYLCAFRTRVRDRREDAAGTWVELDDTAFYPESGGQRPDQGSIAGVGVLDVQADDLGRVWHLVEAPVAGDVDCEVDWARRRDHMEQHCAQHIASQAFLEVTGRDTVSFHMSADLSTFDIAGRQPPLPEEVAAAERRANAIVRENRRVTWRWVGEDELPALGLRRPPQVAPPYRIIEVEGWDRSACGGTHPRSTAEVGLIKLYAGEAVHDAFRIRFYAGDRARLDYAQRAQELDRVAALLGVAPTAAADAVAVRVEELERLQRQASRQRRQLLDLEADRLAAGGGQDVFLALPERGPDDLRDLAARLVARGVPLAVLTGTKDELGAIVLQRGPGEGPHVGEALKALTGAFGGRGGGSAVQAQGALPLAAAPLLDRARERLGRGPA